MVDFHRSCVYVMEDKTVLGGKGLCLLYYIMRILSLNFDKQFSRAKCFCVWPCEFFKRRYLLFFLSAFVLDKILFIYKEPSLLTYSSSIVQEMVLKPSVGKDELLFTEGKYLDILFEELLIKSWSVSFSVWIL